MLILTINTGSSSVKYQCFEMEGEICLAKGQVDRLNSPKPILVYERHDGFSEQLHLPPMNGTEVFQPIFATLLDEEKGILKKLDDIDLDVLERLIDRSVRYMRKKYGA